MKFTTITYYCIFSVEIFHFNAKSHSISCVKCLASHVDVPNEVYSFVIHSKPLLNTKKQLINHSVKTIRVTGHFPKAHKRLYTIRSARQTNVKKRKTPEGDRGNLERKHTHTLRRHSRARSRALRQVSHYNTHDALNPRARCAASSWPTLRAFGPCRSRARVYYLYLYVAGIGP